MFLTYAAPEGHVLLDRELSLPREWADTPERRQEAGVPNEVTFATKPQLAQRMLERALAAGVPAAWVTGDTVYGGDQRLRVWLEQHEQPFVMAVTRDRHDEPLWRARRALGTTACRRHRGGPDPRRRVAAPLGRGLRERVTLV